ncbi:MAG: TolC family protein [Candidatus Marinimicrobia bacterium]|nr:TolC family protein [Candidatus Neomarinimicrobiota bacterium]
MMLFLEKCYHKKYLLIFIFLLQWTSIGFSQNTDYKIYLTLQGSISRALQGNNQLKSSYYGLQKAKWDKYRAWTQFLPTANLSSRYMHIDQQTFRERDFRSYMPPELRDQIPQTVFQESYYTAIDVSMPLFNGVLVNGIRIASAGKKTAQKMNESTRNNILFQVINSYLAVLKSKDLLQLQKDFTNLAKLNYEKAERQHLAGRYSENELLFWEIDYQTQQSSLINTESILRTTKSVLTNLIDMDMFIDFDVESTIPINILNEAENFSNLSNNEILKMIKFSDDELIKANAALTASQSRTKLSKLLYKNTYSSYLPNVNLLYTHAWRENNTLELDDYTPETYIVNLSIPLFTSFQNFSNVKSSYYEYQQSEEDHQNQMDNIRFVLSETANKIIDLKTQRELSKLNVKYSQNNYKIIEQQKERGLISNIDFINTKLALQNNELTDITNQYDFISAIIELNYLLGKLDNVVITD